VLDYQQFKYAISSVSKSCVFGTTKHAKQKQLPSMLKGLY